MGDAKQLISEGAQLFKDGKLEEAIAKLKAAVEEDPSSVLAHSYLGAAFARAGEKPESVEQFQLAVDLDPDSAVHTFNLGQAFENSGSKPRAQALYEKALMLDPKYVRAQQRLEALTGKPVATARPAAPRATPPPAQPPAQAASMPSAPAPAATQVGQSYSPPAGQPQFSGPSPYGPQPQQGVSQYNAPPPPMPGPPPAASGRVSQLEARVGYGAKWLYAIAALSLINTVISLMQVGFRFSVGLGITSFLDALVSETSKHPGMGIASAICLPITFVIIGLYVALGYCASKAMKWAFITGLVLYSLDSVLIVLSWSWVILQS